MKKSSLLLLATAAIFASCSNSEIIDQKEVNTPTTVYPIGPNGEVEVLLGTSSNVSVEAVSRAVVDGWNDTPIRVWGLNKDDAANWTSSTSVLLKGVDGKVQGSPNTGNVILGATGTDRYFYPLTGSVNYSFFACSPLPNNSTTDVHEVTAVYNINGNTDVLWGKAEAVGNGYNAKYFRENTAASKPDIAFGHVLTKLSFVATWENESGTGNTIPTYVDSVKIMSVPSQVVMTVAGANAGAIEATKGIRSIFPLYNAPGMSVTYPVAPKIGEDVNLGIVMLMPATTYTVRVVLMSQVDGKPVRVAGEYPVSLNGNATFEKGKGYKIKLNIKNVREVTLGASLAKWENSTSTDQTVEIE